MVHGPAIACQLNELVPGAVFESGTRLRFIGTGGRTQRSELTLRSETIKQPAVRYPLLVTSGFALLVASHMKAMNEEAQQSFEGAKAKRLNNQLKCTSRRRNAPSFGRLSLEGVILRLHSGRSEIWRCHLAGAVFQLNDEAFITP